MPYEDIVDYIDVLGFLEHPEKDWEVALEQAAADSPGVWQTDEGAWKLLQSWKLHQYNQLHLVFYDLADTDKNNHPY